MVRWFIDPGRFDAITCSKSKNINAHRVEITEAFLGNRAKTRNDFFNCFLISCIPFWSINNCIRQIGISILPSGEEIYVSFITGLTCKPTSRSVKSDFRWLGDSAGVVVKRPSPGSLPASSPGILSYRLGSHGAAVARLPDRASVRFRWGLPQRRSHWCLRGHDASPHRRDAPGLAGALPSPRQRQDFPAGKTHHRYCVHDCIHPSAWFFPGRADPL